MIQEIERKFIVDKLPDLSGLKGHSVLQGYIFTGEGGTEVRIRKWDEQYIMTIKSGGLLKRQETEIPLTKVQFQIFWPSTEGRRIEKTH